VTTAEASDFAPVVTLTGIIMAQVQNDLSLRLSGKMIERNVDVGDHVTAENVLARLDPQEQLANLAAAASLGMIPIAREVFWGPMAYAMIGGGRRCSRFCSFRRST